MFTSTTTAHRVLRLARQLTAATTTYSTPKTMSTVANKEDLQESPVPPNPLGEGRWIRTAACLIIGYVNSHLSVYYRNLDILRLIIILIAFADLEMRF